jgi:hypothetical protein
LFSDDMFGNVIPQVQVTRVQALKGCKKLKVEKSEALFASSPPPPSSILGGWWIFDQH